MDTGKAMLSAKAISDLFLDQRNQFLTLAHLLFAHLHLATQVRLSVQPQAILIAIEVGQAVAQTGQNIFECAYGLAR